MIKKLLTSLLLVFVLFSKTSYAQCTEEKDADMARYKNLTATQDAQGCSQCAMLALYFCSAKYTVKPEDKAQVSTMINACKTNIRNMGQPYCCPELLLKEPQWGIAAGADGQTASNAGHTDKFVRDVQNATAIINAAAPLIEQWKSNRQKRWEEEERRQQELRLQKEEITKLNKEKATEYFKANYLNKLLAAAQDGDENARMKLIFKLNSISAGCSISSGEYVYCDMTGLLPDRSKWIQEALKNDNADAIMLMNAFITKEREAEQVSNLERAANAGSLDAMIQLGDFYDKRFDKLTGLHAGENAEKALAWYSKAAEMGSPKGMYYLGMIYRYGYSRQYGMGVSPKKFNVKYPVTIDNKIAAEWFLKSISLTNYRETLYAQSQRESLSIQNLEPKWISSSIFDFESFNELSKMYAQGQGVEKNIELSKELLNEYKQWRRNYYNDSEVKY